MMGFCTPQKKIWKSTAIVFWKDRVENMGCHGCREEAKVRLEEWKTLTINPDKFYLID